MAILRVDIKTTHRNHETPPDAAIPPGAPGGHRRSRGDQRSNGLFYDKLSQQAGGRGRRRVSRGLCVKTNYILVQVTRPRTVQFNRRGAELYSSQSQERARPETFWCSKNNLCIDSLFITFVENKQRRTTVVRSREGGHDVLVCDHCIRPIACF